MRSFVAGAFGGFVCFAVACAVALAVTRPHAAPAASSGAASADPGPAPLAVVPDRAESDLEPNAAPETAREGPEPTAGPPSVGAAVLPAEPVSPPITVAAAVIQEATADAPIDAPPASAVRPVDAKLAAAAEALRAFRLNVPAITPPPAAPPASIGAATGPAPDDAGPEAQLPVIEVPAPAPKDAVVAPARTEAPRIVARTSTIPRRPAPGAAAPTKVLPDVDPTALMRASESIQRLSRRMRGPNAG